MIYSSWCHKRAGYDSVTKEQHNNMDQPLGMGDSEINVKKVDLL